MLQWLLAALHLLALGIGLGAIAVRASSLRGRLDESGFRRLFVADTLWGVAAAIWIVTGLLRAFAGFEKGTTYYLHNSVFLIKMALLLLILALEVWPMVTLIRWRLRVGRRDLPSTESAATLASISWLQAALVIAMLFAATAMARGYGAGAW